MAIFLFIDIHKDIRYLVIQGSYDMRTIHRYYLCIRSQLPTTTSICGNQMNSKRRRMGGKK